MDGVTVILGLIAVSVLAATVLWMTRNKGVVGKRVMVDESMLQITGMPQVLAEEANPDDDWEVIPVTRTASRRRERKRGADEAVDCMAAAPAHPAMIAEADPLLDSVLPVEVSPAPPPAGTQKALSEMIVVLNVVYNQAGWLDGVSVVNAVRKTGMQYSDPGVFHYMLPDNPQLEPLFSLANMLNPGIFKMDELADLVTPGVTLFMRLPGPVDGVEAFTYMHDTARQIAQALNATLCDEERLVLTEYSALQLRKRIAEYQHTVHVSEKGGTHAN